VDLVTATMMAICCSPPQPACCSPSIYNFNSPSLKPLDRSTQFTMMAQNKPTTSDLLRVRVGGQHDKEMKRSLAESIFEFAEGDKVRKRSAAQPKAKAANVTAAAAAAPAAEDAVQPLPLAALTTVCTPPQPQPPAASALRPSEVGLRWEFGSDDESDDDTSCPRMLPAASCCCHDVDMFDEDFTLR
jgi:hypothetical protein